MLMYLAKLFASMNSLYFCTIFWRSVGMLGSSLASSLMKTS